MIKFEEMQYQSPNFNQLVRLLKEEQEILKNAMTYQEAKASFEHYLDLNNDYLTMDRLCNIRFTLNVNDEYYKDQLALFDFEGPNVELEFINYTNLLIDHQFVEDFKNDYGAHYITILSNAKRKINDSVITLMQEENKLMTSYNDLIANGQVLFNDELQPLTKMARFMEDDDAQVRKASSEAYFQFFKDNQSELEETFDQLVKVRNEIAKNLGFDNYAQYSYIALNRYDYQAVDINALTSNVKKVVIPFINELLQAQNKRIGTSTTKYYDYNVSFKDGGVNPAYPQEVLVENALTMYQELSPETGAFFKYMVDYNLLNLDARPGKMQGGYCTYVSNYKAPYIFANFNNSSHDVVVLTHEAGHAFDVYMNMDERITDYIWGSYDIAEVHSMSMEFFTYPRLNRFFKEEDVPKYKLGHLIACVKFLAYGLLVNEFQEKIYENPLLTPSQRNQLWANLEKEYMPLKDYDGNEILQESLFWYKQPHIFINPLYYVDYVLAQLVALQFYSDMNHNFKDSFNNYIELVKSAGKKPFLKTVLDSNLTSPFDLETLNKVVATIKEELAQNPLY
ncbi:MAG: M3 family oligoendopeptidase [Bacilli bacterium]